MPFRLHAITLTEVAHDGVVAANGGGSPTQENGDHGGPARISFRELSALVSKEPAFAAPIATADSIAQHQAIVDAAFKRGAVLPVPVGVVFRAADVLTRWMELHYVSLTSALEYVDDRAVARVHMRRADGQPDEIEPDPDLAAQAAEAARALRRRAIAGIPLRVERTSGDSLELGSSFLVDCQSWKEFVATVAEQQDAHDALRFDLTGPWAPYDFIRMQFGA